MHSLWRARNLAHPLMILAAAFVSACATDASSPSSGPALIDSTDFAKNGKAASTAATTASVKVDLKRPMLYGPGQVSAVSAIPYDVNGQPLTGKVVSWTTSDARIAKMYASSMV